MFEKMVATVILFYIFATEVYCVKLQNFIFLFKQLNVYAVASIYSEIIFC
jgi:hypothetical protein